MCYIFIIANIFPMLITYMSSCFKIFPNKVVSISFFLTILFRRLITILFHFYFLWDFALRIFLLDFLIFLLDCIVYSKNWILWIWIFIIIGILIIWHINSKHILVLFFLIKKTVSISIVIFGGLKIHFSICFYSEYIKLR